jgi:hypothetical protein
MSDNIGYYDISSRTAPLAIVGSDVWTGSTSEMRREAKAVLLAMRGKIYENTDTGWSITIGRNAIDKTLNESGRREHFQALTKLPELLRNAVRVRKSLDSKGRKEIRAFYRLYAPVVVEGRLFAAQITLREDSDSNRRFYLQRLQIKNPAGDKGASEHPYPAGQDSAAIMGDVSSETQVRSPGSAVSMVSISRLLRDVKSDDAV